jgi:hypothetical protein
LPEKRDIHNDLLFYIILLVVGLIILLDGLGSLPNGWETALLGAGVSAFGGFETKITYTRIQDESNSIKAKQTGKKGIQINQTSPTGSPAIGKARDVYIGTPPPSKVPEPEKRTQRPFVVGPGISNKPEEQFEWLCNGDIHINRYQEFEAMVKKGDQIAWHLESKKPIALTILSRKDADTFLDIIDGNVPSDYEYTFYYRTPATTNYDFSWTSAVGRPVIVVISGGEMDYKKEDFSTQVSAKIKIVHKAFV